MGYSRYGFKTDVSAAGMIPEKRFLNPTVLELADSMLVFKHLLTKYENPDYCYYQHLLNISTHNN